MVDFAGWAMPVQYSTITAEHQAVRKQAGLFDISHMGRIEIVGPNAVDWLDHLLTVDVRSLKLGQVRYTFACREDGGILDDLLVSRMADRYLLVVNASNREKILDWLHQHARTGASAVDQTLHTGMIALQGPRAWEILRGLVPDEVGQLKNYRTWESAGDGVISRTGYTGEDGFEWILPAARVGEVWDRLLSEGQARGLAPCGLGCRDTLRLEAAMPLYGHELSENIDPLTAGLGFAVHLDGRSFIGQPALAAVRAAGFSRTRVGILLAGRRIAREHSPVLSSGQIVGEVTSGTFSPTLEQSLAMAYVNTAVASPGQEIAVSIRGSNEPAQIVKLPFYSRKPLLT